MAWQQEMKDEGRALRAYVDVLEERLAKTVKALADIAAGLARKDVVDSTWLHETKLRATAAACVKELALSEPKRPRAWRL